MDRMRSCTVMRCSPENDDQYGSATLPRETPSHVVLGSYFRLAKQKPAILILGTPFNVVGN